MILSLPIQKKTLGSGIRSFREIEENVRFEGDQKLKFEVNNYFMDIQTVAINHTCSCAGGRLFGSM